MEAMSMESLETSSHLLERNLQKKKNQKIISKREKENPTISLRL